jgi:putative oxidoreductase
MFEYHPFTSLFPPVFIAAQGSAPAVSAGAAALGSDRQARVAGEGAAPGGWWGRLRSSSPAGHELGLALVRLGFGASLALAHGLPKLTNAGGFVGHLAQGGFPGASFLGWAAILSELVGGLLLAFGLLTRPAAAFVLVTLAVAAFHVHASDPFGKKELALAYVLVALATLVAGPGRFSLDSVLASRRAGFRGSAPPPEPRAG